MSQKNSEPAPQLSGVGLHVTKLVSLKALSKPQKYVKMMAFAFFFFLWGLGCYVSYSWGPGIVEPPSTESFGT